MLVAVSEKNDGKRVLYLGLGPFVMRCLESGQPVRVVPNHECDAIPSGYEVCLLACRDEAEMRHALVQSGLIQSDGPINRMADPDLIVPEGCELIAEVYRPNADNRVVGKPRKAAA